MPVQPESFAVEGTSCVKNGISVEESPVVNGDSHLVGGHEIPVEINRFSLPAWPEPPRLGVAAALAIDV